MTVFSPSDLLLLLPEMLYRGPFPKAKALVGAEQAGSRAAC